MENKRSTTRSRDPFAVDPLPKAYYYPSPERCLNKAEKATALKTSHNLEVEEGEKKRNEKTDPLDEMFLKGTNMYQTKPSGPDDVEDEDNFDETWPSSERPSALSFTGLEDESPVNLNKYLSQLDRYGGFLENTGIERTKDQVNTYERIRMPGSSTQGSGVTTSRDTGKPFKSKIPVKNAAQGGAQEPRDVKLVNDKDASITDGAVLQRYIDRFRNSRPTSREEREKKGKSASQDFWWLSNGLPPVAVPSTTKDDKPERSTSHTTPLTTVNLDKYKHLQQLAEKQTPHPYIPESPGDKRTIELQERAEKLLERSSSTVLSTEPAVSTEGLGSNTSDMSSLDEYSYRPKFASYLDSNQRVGKPQLRQPPLLGQELQGQRARYQSLVPPPLPGQREPAEDDPLYQWRLRRRMELAQQSAPQHTQQFDFINKSEQQKKIDQKLEEFKQKLSGRRPAHTQFTPAPQPCHSQMTHMHICNNIQAEEQRFHEPPIASPSLHPPKPKSEHIEEIDPHLHLMCDLLPCPHRGKFEGTVDTRPSSNDKENFSNDIEPKDDSSEGKEKSCINKEKYKQYLEAEKPDVEKVAQERDLSKVDNTAVDNKDNKSIEEIENLVKNIGGKDDDEQLRSERSGDKDYKKSVCGRDNNERSKRKVQKDSEEKSNDQSGSDSECSQTKSKHLDREVSSDGRLKDSEGKRDKVIKPKHSSSPKSGRRGVNAAIDQVIKEHLFCTSTSTVLSSVDSLPPSASSERLPWKQKPPSHNQAHDLHVKPLDDDTPYESDEDFPDDNLLQMLRTQRAMYEHQLQEIDAMLNKIDS